MGQTERRLKVISRLEDQLSDLTKPNKVNGKTVKERIALSDKDVKRIEKELISLKLKTKY